MVTLLVSSSSHTDDEGNKKIKEASSNEQTNKNSEHVTNFLPDLFAIITQLTLSNLIAMVM